MEDLKNIMVGWVQLQGFKTDSMQGLEAKDKG